MKSIKLPLQEGILALGSPNQRTFLLFFHWYDSEGTLHTYWFIEYLHLAIVSNTHQLVFSYDTEDEIRIIGIYVI